MTEHVTELMPAWLALIEVLDGYRQSSTLWLFDESEQPCIALLHFKLPCYGLTTLCPGETSVRLSRACPSEGLLATSSTRFYALSLFVPLVAHVLLALLVGRDRGPFGAEARRQFRPSQG